MKWDNYAINKQKLWVNKQIYTLKWEKWLLK